MKRSGLMAVVMANSRQKLPNDNDGLRAVLAFFLQSVANRRWSMLGFDGWLAQSLMLGAIERTLIKKLCQPL